MRRRLIPYGVSGLVTTLTAITVWLSWPSDRVLNRATLAFLCVVFLFLSILFFQMRKRMVAVSNHLTIFGEALVDFFTGLTLFALIMTVIQIVQFVYAFREDGEKLPLVTSLLVRSAAIGAGMLILGTGFAVGFEMSKVEGQLLVHEDDGEAERGERRVFTT